MPVPAMAISQTAGLVSASLTLKRRICSRLLRSDASCPTSQALSSGASHVASDGLAGSAKKNTRPSAMVGSACSANSHCHPCRPRAPSSSRMGWEISDPAMIENGVDSTRSVSMRTRYLPGNHWVMM